MHARYHVRTANSLEIISFKRLKAIPTLFIIVMKQTSQFVNGTVQNGYKNNMNINKQVYVYTYTFPGCKYINNTRHQKFKDTGFFMAYEPKHNCQIA